MRPFPRLPWMLQHRGGDDRGSMMVLLSVAMVALLSLGGLVIDGGRAYADHRSMQNAADAAALAGTGALNKILFTTGQSDKVQQAVDASVAANAPGATVVCRIIDSHQNDLGSCPAVNSAPISVTAAGVSVSLTHVLDGSFIKVAGIETFTTEAAAKAQVQGLRGASSPFMICGLDAAHNGQDPPLLIESAPGSGFWLINSASVYNPGNGGPIYRMHAPQVPNCDTSSDAFKGLVDDSVNYPTPGTWSADTGVHAGPVRNVLARPDACTDKSQLDTTAGCTIIVPMCVDGEGQGSSMAMFCVRFGAFHVYQVASNEHDARFLGAAVVTSGAGGSRPVANEARVVRLSE